MKKQEALVERFTVDGANSLTEVVPGTEHRVWYSRLIPELVARGVLVKRGKAWFGNRADIARALTTAASAKKAFRR